MQNLLLALALVILATAAGVLAGGRAFPLASVSLGFTGLAFWASRRDWLAKPAPSARLSERLSSVCVLLGAVLFAWLYVFLTGGVDSPLTFALYLPLVLAAICFGAGAGIVSGIVMALIYVAGLGWQDPHQPLARVDWEGTLSFPLVAVTISLLTKRNEERLLALHTRTRDLDALLDMSMMMDAAIDLEMTMNLALLNVQKMSQCETCAIYLKESSGVDLELRAVITPRRCPPLPPALGAIDFRDASLNSRMLSDEDSSHICLPLTCVEGTLGILYVGDHAPRLLHTETVNRLELFADRAAFAIQRAQTQQDFEQLAYSDAMTGLDNYRQFERTLQDELLRAQRYGRPLSVLMLDIDHFKSFNDTLGHPAGDSLLAQIGTALRNTLRSVDRPARYGGEEFAVICPETGAAEAELIAERIRRAVADTPFALTNAAEDCHNVTVSVGYATSYRESSSASSLIKRADLALYRAKHAGRNRVCGYNEFEEQVKAA